MISRRTFSKAALLAPAALANRDAAADETALASAPKRRKQLLALLGDLPPLDRPIGARLLATEERAGYTLERLVLDLNGSEPVPAYFVKPRGATKPLPTVLYNHAHGGDYKLGKDELLLGRKDLTTPP